MRGLTLRQRLLLDAGQAIGSEPTERIGFLHSVLCQAGLPRRRTEARAFERRSGHMSTLLEAGKLFDGESFVDQPLPYGVIPRLIMVHLSTEAVRTQQRSIEVGESVRRFLQTLGVSTSGGKRGGYTALRRQLHALAACRMTLGMQAHGRAITVDTRPIQRFEAWVSHERANRTLWPGVLELSEGFFSTLTQHAVPLDSRALAALRHSSLALDLYAWLAHRLYRVRAVGGVKLSWWNLYEQFGQEYGCSRDFKREARRALRQVLAVYPGARVGEVIGGIVLYPSMPPVHTKCVRLHPIRSE